MQLTSSTGAGAGPSAVNITVEDPSNNPIQNAVVSLTQGLTQYYSETNVSGVAAFSVNNATYTVAITAPGYTFTPVSLVVGAALNETYNMSLSAPPSGAVPPTTLGYITTVDGSGTIESGVEIQFEFISDNGNSGISTSTNILTATSSGTEPNNLTVQLRQNCVYQARRGTQLTWTKFTTPQTENFELPSVVGQP